MNQLIIFSKEKETKTGVKIGYNIKKAILPVIGGALLFGATSCEKEDPYKAAKEVCAAKYHVDSVYTWNNNLKKCVGTFIGDPNQAEIETLTKQIKELTEQMPTLIYNAKFVDENIESYFNMLFTYPRGPKQNPQNLRDSSERFTHVVDQARIEFGNPLPSNNETMTELDSKCADFMRFYDRKELLTNSKKKALVK